jgi:hypothetical protein
VSLWDILTGKLPFFKTSYSDGRIPSDEELAVLLNRDSGDRRDWGPKIQDAPMPLDYAVKAKQSTLPTGQVTIQIGTTPTRICGDNPSRDGIAITNPDEIQTVFIGSSTVSATTGQELLPLQTIVIPLTDAIYGVLLPSSTTTVTVSYLEVNQE